MQTPLTQNLSDRLRQIMCKIEPAACGADWLLACHFWLLLSPCHDVKFSLGLYHNGFFFFFSFFFQVWSSSHSSDAMEIPLPAGCFISVYVKYPATPFKTELFSIWIIKGTFTWTVLTFTFIPPRYCTLYLPGCSTNCCWTAVQDLSHRDCQY